MLRVKKEHLGKRISKGNDTITLTDELSQRELLFICNMVSDSFIEDVPNNKKKGLTKGDAEADLNGTPRPDNPSKEATEYQKTDEYKSAMKEVEDYSKDDGIRIYKDKNSKVISTKSKKKKKK